MASRLGVGIIATACAGLLWPLEAGAEPASAQWGEPAVEEAEEVEDKGGAEADEVAEPSDSGTGDAAESEPEAPAPAAKPRTQAKAKAKAKPRTKRADEKGRAKRGPPPPPPSRKRRAKDAQEEFEEATSSGEQSLERRRRAEERAARGIEDGAPLEAARDLAVIAELDDDPALMIGAAEAALAGVGTVAGAEEVARVHASAGRARIEELRSSDDEYALLRLGLEEEDLRQLEVRAKAASTRASVASARAERAEAQSRSLRIAKGEVISGAVLAGLGASGLAMMGSGIYLRRSADRELEAAGVDELGELSPELRRPFERQYDQASTLTAGGAVLGAVGTALGVTLIAAGVRDLKRAGWRSERRASLRGRPRPVAAGRASSSAVVSSDVIRRAEEPPSTGRAPPRAAGGDRRRARRRPAPPRCSGSTRRWGGRGSTCRRSRGERCRPRRRG